MKRRLSLCFSVLCILLIVVSCASNKKVEKPVDSETPPVVEEVTLAKEEIETTEEILPEFISEEVVEEFVEEYVELPKVEMVGNALFANGHDITVYLNDGVIEESIPDLINGANESGYIVFPEVKKDGYSFKGWLDLDTGVYLEGSGIAIGDVGRDVRLSAVFELDVTQASITSEVVDNEFVLNFTHPSFDISVSAPLESKINKTVDEIYSEAVSGKYLLIPSLEMENFVFLGWKEKNEDSFSENIILDLNNLGEKKEYKAYFDIDLTKAVIEKGVDEETFWIKASYLGLSISATAPIDSSIEKNTPFPLIIKNAIKDKVLVLPTLERKGYTFLGWRRVGEEKVDNNVSINIRSITESLEYEAVFEKIVYTISYDEMGVTYVAKVEEPVIVPVIPPAPVFGTVKYTNPNSYTIDDSFTLVNPERTGYTFVGWILEGEESYQARNTEEIVEGTIGNKNYVAVWLPNSYSISLNLNGGEMETIPVSFLFDSPVFTLGEPVKKDYVFLGWKSGDSEPVVSYTVDTSSAEDVSLEAVWAPKEYTIEYNNNVVLYSPKPEPLPEPEVIPENPVKYTVEDGFTLYNPSIEGYIFKGWIEDGEESYEARETYTLEKGTSGNKKLSAVWIPMEYNISYDFNGGEVDGEEPLTFVFNENSPSFIEPVLPYYQFMGWVDESKGILEPSKTLDTSIPGDATLKAIWKPVEYVIDYDLDGGELGEGSASSFTVESDVISTVIPTKSGYEFVGWIVKNDKPNTIFSLSLKKDDVRTNLNAFSDHLEIYTSLFTNKTKAALSSAMMKAGVSGVMENGVLSVNYKNLDTEEILSLVDSILNGTGIVVDGTYYGSKEIVPSVSIASGSTESISLKAVWKVIVYSIDYDEDGVIFGSDMNRKAENSCWYTVESAFELVNPEKKGYDFVGWILEGESTSKARSIYEFSKGTTGDKNLVAVWKPSTYSINLDTNGGKIDEYPTTYSYMSDSISLPNPEKENYEFLGWKEKGNKDSQLKSNYRINTGDMGDVSLVATWAPVEYSITYSLNGGKLADGVENPSSYTVEDSNIILAIPSRFGYTFLGWTEDPYAVSRTYSLRYIVNTKRGENLEITAKWAPIEYSITYALDGGTYRYDNSNPTKYTIESNGIYLANPVKEGYTFLGWIMGGDKTETLRKGQVLPPGYTGNVKFYAVWEKNTVAIGEATKKQIEKMEYGKDNIPRPDWMVQLPQESGVHYEKAFSTNSDLFEAINEASEECRRLISEWAGTTFKRSERAVDGNAYITSGIEYSNVVKKADVVEYWQDKSGKTWVLMKINENDIDIR